MATKARAIQLAIAQTNSDRDPQGSCQVLVPSPHRLGDSISNS